MTDLELIRELADLHTTAIVTSASVSRVTRDVYQDIASDIHHDMMRLAAGAGAGVLDDTSLLWRLNVEGQASAAIYEAWAGHLEALTHE